MIRFSVSWLPKLIKYDTKTSFTLYYEAIYEYFKEDFIYTKPVFQGRTVALQREPRVNGKEQTFHHMTTKDVKIKDSNGTRIVRLPAVERCERIKWNKAILESNFHSLKIFPQKRSHNRHNIVIWFEEIDYLIILRDAKTYYVFITAYPMSTEHKRRALRKSYESYKKAETTL